MDLGVLSLLVEEDSFNIISSYIFVNRRVN